MTKSIGNTLGYSSNLGFLRWVNETLLLLKDGKNYWYWAADWVFAPQYAPTWKKLYLCAVKMPRRRSPRLRDSVQHALRKCICYWQAPSSGQTWRLWIWVPYHSLCWREEVSLHWDSPQGATSIPTSSGNHGWLGHFGATDITYYFSSLILQSTRGRSLTGGKAYLHTFGQLWASASTPRGECEWIKQRAVSVLHPAEYTPYFF